MHIIVFMIPYNILVITWGLVFHKNKMCPVICPLYTCTSMHHACCWTMYMQHCVKMWRGEVYFIMLLNLDQHVHVPHMHFLHVLCAGTGMYPTMSFDVYQGMYVHVTCTHVRVRKTALLSQALQRLCLRGICTSCTGAGGVASERWGTWLQGDDGARIQHKPWKKSIASSFLLLTDGCVHCMWVL